MKTMGNDIKAPHLSKEQIAEAKDDLDKLNGRGRHATPSNICWGDGYFARSLEEKYGMSLQALEAAVEEPPHEIRFLYRNWRGEVGMRTVQNPRLEFRAVAWHGPDPVWCIVGLDPEKGAERHFAVSGILSFDPAAHTPAPAADAPIHGIMGTKILPDPGVYTAPAPQAVDAETAGEFAEHTPGPWEYVQGDGQFASAVFGKTNVVCDFANDPCAEDARLIAAAPTLLARATAAAYALSCFEAAEVEGLSEAIGLGHVERIQDIWRRRVEFGIAALRDGKMGPGA